MVAAPETKEIQKDSVVENHIVVKGEEAMELEKDPAIIEAKTKEAGDKLALGKKAMLLNKPQDAVESLADACGIMASVVGDLAIEMCEYHFQYGKALLELARVEEGVLGNALKGVPDESVLEDSQVEDPDKLSPEEKEEVAEKVDAALAENFSAVKDKDGKGEEEVEKEKSNVEEEGANAPEETAKDVKSPTKKSADKETALVTKEEESKSKEEESKSKEEESESKEEESKSKEEESKSKEEESESKEEESESKEEESESKDEESESKDEEEEMETDEKEADGDPEDMNESDGESQEDSQDEDIGSLQLAYEVLETCKTIYLKQEERSEEMDLKLSQVYLKLGEVAMENEKYVESAELLKDCLSIQENFLSSDDRLLAETHYQLCIAHSFANNYDDAINHAENAVKVIKTCINNKTNALKEKGIELTADTDISNLGEHKEIASEIKDLEKILPEMEEKITDVKETKKTCMEKLKSMKEEFMNAFKSSSPFESQNGSTSSAPAKPISTSLIKKRPKPEDEGESTSETSKKAKIEEVNGQAEEEKSKEKTAE